MRIQTRLIAGALLAVAAALTMIPVAQGAALFDIKVDSVTGSGSFTGKTANIHEGDTVTVGIYLSNLQDAAENSNGLGAYFASIRSFDEQFNVPGSPTAFSGGPTTTVTVVNATTCALTTPENFGLVPTQGTGPVQDITGDQDPDDLDLDIKKMGVSQDVAGSGPFALAYGTGATPIEIGTATFTALDLDDGTFAFNRTVHLNTYYTSPSGTNGGLILNVLTDNSTTSNSLGDNVASTQIIGTDVIVTVTPVPEPSTLILGLIGGAALWTVRRRRSARVKLSSAEWP